MFFSLYSLNICRNITYVSVYFYNLGFLSNMALMGGVDESLALALTSITEKQQFVTESFKVSCWGSQGSEDPGSDFWLVFNTFPYS